MNILEVLQKLRDDLQYWVLNQILSIINYIDRRLEIIITDLNNTKTDINNQLNTKMNKTNPSGSGTFSLSGNAYVTGKVYAGGKELTTKEYVDIRVPAWTTDDEGKILRIVEGVPTWTGTLG